MPWRGTHPPTREPHVGRDDHRGVRPPVQHSPKALRLHDELGLLAARPSKRRVGLPFGWRQRRQGAGSNPG
jgi:hypothetical protein